MDITTWSLFALIAVLGIWLWYTLSKIDDLLAVIHKIEGDTNSSLQYIRNDISSLQQSYEIAQRKLDGKIVASTEKYAWTQQKANQIEENKQLLFTLVHELGYKMEIIDPQPFAQIKLKKVEKC